MNRTECTTRVEGKRGQNQIHRGQRGASDGHAIMRWLQGAGESTGETGFVPAATAGTNDPFAGQALPQTKAENTVNRAALARRQLLMCVSVLAGWSILMHTTGTPEYSTSRVLARWAAHAPAVVLLIGIPAFRLIEDLVEPTDWRDLMLASVVLVAMGHWWWAL